MELSKRKIGVGLRPKHYDLFQGNMRPNVAWVEVITENFFPRDRSFSTYRPFQQLMRVREGYPVAMHGVSLSLASADSLSSAYLSKLKSLVDLVDPWMISDHLCWTGIHGYNLHDLLPFSYSKEALIHIVSKIQKVQDVLGRAIAIENISAYIQFAKNEYSETEFLNEVARRSGCLFLLDINNIYVNSVNHKFDPRTFIRGIDLSRVAQVHLAGHEEAKSGLLVDTHGAPICEDVWKLYSWFHHIRDGVPVMIERDSNIPEWPELEAELEKIVTAQKRGLRYDFELDAFHNPTLAASLGVAQ